MQTFLHLIASNSFTSCAIISLNNASLPLLSFRSISSLYSGTTESNQKVFSSSSLSSRADCEISWGSSHEGGGNSSALGREEAQQIARVSERVPPPSRPRSHQLSPALAVIIVRAAFDLRGGDGSCYTLVLAGSRSFQKKYWLLLAGCSRTRSSSAEIAA